MANDQKETDKLLPSLIQDLTSRHKEFITKSEQNPLLKKTFDLLLDPKSNFADQAIRKAIYRGFSLLYHPDKNPQGTELFKFISNITTNLTDADISKDPLVLKPLHDLRAALNPAANTQKSSFTKTTPPSPPKPQQPNSNSKQQYSEPNFRQQHSQSNSRQQYSQSRAKHEQNTGGYNTYAQQLQHKNLISQFYLSYNKISILSQQINVLQHSATSAAYKKQKLVQHGSYLSTEYATILKTYSLLDQLLKNNPSLITPEWLQIKSLMEHTVTPIYNNYLTLLKRFNTNHTQSNESTTNPKAKSQEKSDFQQKTKEFQHKITELRQLMEKIISTEKFNEKLYKQAVEQYDSLFTELDSYESIKSSLKTTIKDLKAAKDQMFSTKTKADDPTKKLELKIAELKKLIVQATAERYNKELYKQAIAQYDSLFTELDSYNASKNPMLAADTIKDLKAAKDQMLFVHNNDYNRSSSKTSNDGGYKSFNRSGSFDSSYRSYDSRSKFSFDYGYKPFDSSSSKANPTYVPRQFNSNTPKQTETLLANYLATNPSLSPKDTGAILLKLMLALNELHKQNMIHGDLSSKYILYNPTTQTVSIQPATVTARELSKDKHYILLPKDFPQQPYHAPETSPDISKNRLSGYRSDIYSIGVFIEEHIKNKDPFLRDTIKQMLKYNPNDRGNTIEWINIWQQHNLTASKSTFNHKRDRGKGN